MRCLNARDWEVTDVLTARVFVVALEEFAPIPDRFAMGMVKQQVAYVILVHVTSRTQFVIQQMVLVRYIGFII